MIAALVTNLLLLCIIDVLLQRFYRLLYLLTWSVSRTVRYQLLLLLICAFNGQNPQGL